MIASKLKPMVLQILRNHLTTEQIESITYLDSRCYDTWITRGCNVPVVCVNIDLQLKDGTCKILQEHI